MLARIVNMRGVDLRRFDFDYDLTWAAFFLTPQGNILGRFGGRDAESPDKYLTLAGLKHSMESILRFAQFKATGRPPPAEAPEGVGAVEQYPAARRLKADACIHCHQVYDFRRDLLRSKDQWTRERIWGYPLPEKLGFSVDPERQDRVKSVQADSPAAKAGLKAGDVIANIGDLALVSSFADIQYALHLAPPAGKLSVNLVNRIVKIDLAEGWRETDISWRESMWGLEPAASVHGADLSADEKRKLGLGPKRLAFKQGNFVPPAARGAGIRAGDIITGIDGKELEMTMLQFNAWVRLNYKVGDKITFDVLRDGKKVTVPMMLPKKSF